MADMPHDQQPAKYRTEQQVEELFKLIAKLRSDIDKLKAERPPTFHPTSRSTSRVNAISASPYDLSQRRGLL
jgi:hypothetical protein